MRGCSLMVKPQSSKLITRVRFPSSPPLQRLRRKRRGLLRSGMMGIAYGRKYIPSRARDFRPPTRHPLENCPERICGNPFRMRICFLARSESACSSSSSPPLERHSGYKDFRVSREVSGVAFSLFWGGFRGVGAWSPRAVEALLVVADWAFEAASQWVPWPVEGGSVKWCPSRHAPARPEAQSPIGVALVRGSYKSESTR